MLRPLEHRFQTTERRAQRVRIRSGETDSPSVLATTRPGPTSNASATASAQHLPTATAAAICRSSAKRASRTHERGGLTPHWWPRPARRRPICRAAAGLARLSSASLPLFLALPRREKRKRRIFCSASWKPKWNGSECSCVDVLSVPTSINLLYLATGPSPIYFSREATADDPDRSQ
jgi:hypothetical protein